MTKPDTKTDRMPNAARRAVTAALAASLAIGSMAGTASVALADISTTTDPALEAQCYGTYGYGTYGYGRSWVDDYYNRANGYNGYNGYNNYNTGLYVGYDGYNGYAESRDMTYRDAWVNYLNVYVRDLTGQARTLVNDAISDLNKLNTIVGTWNGGSVDINTNVDVIINDLDEDLRDIGVRTLDRTGYLAYYNTYSRYYDYDYDYWYRNRNRSRYYYDDSSSSTTKETKAVYRLVDGKTGDHIYTTDTEVKDSLVKGGATLEGTGWKSPVKADSKTPVYQLRDTKSSRLMYTTSTAERDGLVQAGWVNDGEVFYSDDEHHVPVLRIYNDTSAMHFFTTSTAERDNLVKAGWRDEGVAFYASANA
jgi:hypothetical protein